MKAILKLYGFSENQLLTIESNELINVSAYTDKNRENVNKFINGKIVLSTYDAVKEYKADEDIIFIVSDSLKYDIKVEMVEELHIYGVSKDNIYVYMADSLCKWEEYHYLPYIEYHVADHCNLNCKGCVHFSPLVKEPVFPKYEEVACDLSRLKELVPYIGEIHILGGEPLLNKDLYKYVELTYNLYPKSTVRIITNGLLVRQIDENLIETMKRCNTEFAISLYKPMLSQIDKTMEYLDKVGIKYSCSSPISEFAYTFDKESGHALGAKSLNCSCPNLYHGKLAVCPPIAYIRYFNQRFNTTYSETEGLIDIYDKEMNYSKLISELHKVQKICDNCLFLHKEDLIPLKWEQTKEATVEDYVWGQ